MKYLLPFSLLTILFFSASCTGNQGPKNETSQTGKALDAVVYSSVDELFLHAELLSGKSVHISGIVDHVCKNTGKRFKIINKDGSLELKIELPEKFPSCDPSIMGKTAKVSGKLVPVNLNADGVKKWEAQIRENHRGEEDTDHFKAEIAMVQKIISQIEKGEISYYVQYYVEAEQYTIE